MTHTLKNVNSNSCCKPQDRPQGNWGKRVNLELIFRSSLPIRCTKMVEPGRVEKRTNRNSAAVSFLRNFNGLLTSIPIHSLSQLQIWLFFFAYLINISPLSARRAAIVVHPRSVFSLRHQVAPLKVSIFFTPRTFQFSADICVISWTNIWNVFCCNDE